MQTKKKNVYIVDLGTGTNRNLLPLGAGYISSYAKSIKRIDENYDVHIRFLRQGTQAICDGFDNPVLVGFACYIWNFQATMHLARRVKEQFPNAIIVLGGSSVPKRPGRMEVFFKEYPFLDVLVLGEGEYTFAGLLMAQLEARGLETVDGIAYRDSQNPQGFSITAKRQRIVDLNSVPSPFLDGTFDVLMKEYGSYVTGTVWETNRGCPFSCTFCDWGGADVVKISKFDEERLYQEMEWMSRNRIYYIYGADANFGIFYDRDLAIANRLAQLCTQTGFPKFLMINWTKNSHEKIVAIADVLRQGGVLTNVTLAVQSFYPETLKAIKRVNIKTESLLQLKAAFHDRHLSTYTELILGLPRETYASFVAGINQAMTNRLDDHFVIYLCTILENTEMATDEYVKEHQIEVRNCQVAMTRRVFDKESPLEIEKIVVGTAAMPMQDWRRSYRVGYFAAVFYNFRLAFFIMNFFHAQKGMVRTDWVEFVLKVLEKSKEGDYPLLRKAFHHIERQMDMILSGISSVSTVDGLGEMVLSPYEALLYILLEQKEAMYEELQRITRDFISMQGWNISDLVLKDLFLYQKSLMPSWPHPTKDHFECASNLPLYFQALTQAHALPAIEEEAVRVELDLPQERFDNKMDAFFSRVRSGHTHLIYQVKASLKGSHR